jgi:hypothetical protein
MSSAATPAANTATANTATANTPAANTATQPIQFGSLGTMPVEDAKKLKAKDIGFSFGMPLTEEEFLEYRARRGASNVTVLR